MSLLQLALTYFYIGLFTIGGGQVAITLMYQPMVEGGFITAEEFYNMLAVSESTPGPIGINMATYVGYKMYGVWGGIVTTFSTVLPSLIIILLLASALKKQSSSPLVKTVFSFIRPVSAGLVAVAFWNVFRISAITLDAAKASGSFCDALNPARIIFYAAATCVLIKFKKVPPLLVMLFGAIFGLLFL